MCRVSRQSLPSPNAELAHLICVRDSAGLSSRHSSQRQHDGSGKYHKSSGRYFDTKYESSFGLYSSGRYNSGSGRYSSGRYDSLRYESMRSFPPAAHEGLHSDAHATPPLPAPKEQRKGWPAALSMKLLRCMPTCMAASVTKHD